MGTSKIAISLDEELLGRLDGLVRRRVFPREVVPFRRLSRRRLPVWSGRGSRASAPSSILSWKPRLPKKAFHGTWAHGPNTERRDPVGRSESASEGASRADVRPVLILSADVFNERSGTVIAVAITSQQPRAGFPLTLELGARACRSGPGSRSARFVHFPWTAWKEARPRVARGTRAGRSRG